MGFKRLLLFAWALVFTTVMKLQLPETTFGAVGFTLVIWAAFYPFVTTTTIRVSTYWLMLAASLPTVLIVFALGDSIPFRAQLTMAIMAVAMAALLLKRFRRSSNQRLA